MRPINTLLETLGTDKVLHFAVGAVLNAMLYPLGKEYTIIGIMAVFMLSCVKEFFDSFEKGNKCDWLDVLAGTLGSAAMCSYYYII